MKALTFLTIRYVAMAKNLLINRIKHIFELKSLLRITVKCSLSPSILLAILFFSTGVINAQVSSSPAFPSRSNSITIVFDATKGNQALLGHSGDVYIHTGLITDQSNPDNPPDPVGNPGDWKFIKTAFGQNTSATKMTRLETNLYSITISDVDAYYGSASANEI